MKKIITLTLLLTIVLVAFCACSEKLVYSVPTQDQLDKFILDNSINVIETKQAEEFTIILFQNDRKYGHYILQKDQNNKLYHGSMNAALGGDYHPISTGGIATGKEPFVTVIFNDEDMQKKAKYIELTLYDGDTIKEEVVGKGVILIISNIKLDKPFSYLKLAIYDKDSNLLYEQ
jgi:hypothetical protein